MSHIFPLFPFLWPQSKPLLPSPKLYILTRFLASPGSSSKTENTHTKHCCPRHCCPYISYKKEPSGYCIPDTLWGTRIEMNTQLLISWLIYKVCKKRFMVGPSRILDFVFSPTHFIFINHLSIRHFLYITLFVTGINFLKSAPYFIDEETDIKILATVHNAIRC